MTSAALAWKGMARDPLRAALAIAGLAAVGALLFDMLLLSRGLIVSFRDLLDSIGFDVRVSATEAFPTLGPPIPDATAVAEQIRALPQVEQVVPLSVGRGWIVAGGKEEAVNLLGVGAHARGYWAVAVGAGLPETDDPSGPIPLVVTEALAARLGLAPGDAVRLRGAAGKEESSITPSLPARVTGVGRAAFDAPSEGTALTTMAGFAASGAARSAGEADLLLIASKQGHAPDETVDAIRAAVPGVYPFSNEQFLTRFDRSDFSYFRQISFVLSAITLFFAFLLVATILTVSVNQRLGEVAALRALGFSRRRVVADLLWESAFLVGIGGAASVPLGLLLARWLDGILKSIPGLPERLHFFVFEPRVAVLHAALLAGTAVAAALYPVWLAATLPIAATLRREVVS